jgi:tRNA 2-thiouridine synthesizing protein A
VDRLVDARGLRCPLPLVKARAALADLGPQDALVVLATDPEAPIDLGALATDAGRPFSAVAVEDGWRFELGPVQNL